MKLSKIVYEAPFLSKISPAIACSFKVRYTGRLWRISLLGRSRTHSAFNVAQEPRWSKASKVYTISKGTNLQSMWKYMQLLKMPPFSDTCHTHRVQRHMYYQVTLLKLNCKLFLLSKNYHKNVIIYMSKCEAHIMRHVTLLSHSHRARVIPLISVAPPEAGLLAARSLTPREMHAYRNTKDSWSRTTNITNSAEPPCGAIDRRSAYCLDGPGFTARPLRFFFLCPFQLNVLFFYYAYI